MGRKRKPTDLRVIEGNRGKRRLHENEPDVTDEAPDAPLHLSAEALEEWERITSVAWWAKSADMAIVAAYCQAYGRWVQAERALAEVAKRDPLTKGLMIRTTNGNAVQNPLVGTANKAAGDMARYASEIGLTPTSRSRVSADNGGGGSTRSSGSGYIR